MINILSIHNQYSKLTGGGLNLKTHWYNTVILLVLAITTNQTLYAMQSSVTFLPAEHSVENDSPARPLYSLYVENENNHYLIYTELEDDTCIACKIPALPEQTSTPQQSNPISISHSNKEFIKTLDHQVSSNNGVWCCRYSQSDILIAQQISKSDPTAFSSYLQIALDNNETNLWITFSGNNRYLLIITKELSESTLIVRRIDLETQDIYDDNFPSAEEFKNATLSHDGKLIAILKKNTVLILNTQEETTEIKQL